MNVSLTFFFSVQVLTVFQLWTEEEMVPEEVHVPHLLSLGFFAASLAGNEGKQLFVGLL